MRKQTFKFLKSASLALSAPLILSGCLSSSDSSSPAPDTAPAGPVVTNTPPVISGNPATGVITGSNYSFTPTASDADGDTLTFSVENLPGWASFESTTGRVSGQPLLGDVGSYANIVITVSDGSASASLGGFDITVATNATGSVTLSWSAPLSNTDGSTLTDLAGFRIYYGIEEGVYTEQINIDNPSISTYVVDGLLPDTYYFVATSLNSSGAESTYSNVAVKVVEGS